MRNLIETEWLWLANNNASELDIIRRMNVNTYLNLMKAQYEVIKKEMNAIKQR